jgi:hypothetical protein
VGYEELAPDPRQVVNKCGQYRQKTRLSMLLETEMMNGEGRTLNRIGHRSAVGSPVHLHHSAFIV